MTGLNRKKLWKFWVDRGGTFTDVVACNSEGELSSIKVLSENPEKYNDSAVQGIKKILGLSAKDNIPGYIIDNVRIGTTIATNALLEGKGDDTLLLITKGLKDILKIGYQVRPKLFDLNIKLPNTLYKDVAEIEERISSNGDILIDLDENKTIQVLRKYYKEGYRTISVCFMHAYRYNLHERIIGKLASDIGFTQISLSHKVSPMTRIISRGYATVLDAYLSPVLRRYVNQVNFALGLKNKNCKKLFFMKSDGGLSDADCFQGKDAILSGPAGGVVGMAQTAKKAGFNKVIGFDMGGTSTDVCHYEGEYERTYNSEVIGVKIHLPMMNIHTIAAGGGSILSYRNGRMQVGPESAGANPGPACYRKGGNLTITDCNLLLGKIQINSFPKIFGPNADLCLDLSATKEKFKELANKISKNTGEENTPEQIAEGFVKIAVESMANAIKKISVQKGYKIDNYIINCYGGAGGQHVCQVADVLGIKKIFIHKFAGILSALGMGLANITATRQFQLIESINKHKKAKKILNVINKEVMNELLSQGILKEQISIFNKAHIRTIESDQCLIIKFSNIENMRQEFNDKHLKRYGFIPEYDDLIIEMLTAEAIGASHNSISIPFETNQNKLNTYVKMFTLGSWHQVKLFKRESINVGEKIKGPAIIVDDTGTNIIEHGWQSELLSCGALLLTRVANLKNKLSISTKENPVMLEIFYNLFMTIADQMGYTLSQTASSVNMKERLDFSCAIFDKNGNLIANAPHVPVHLGSMSDSVKSILNLNKNKIHPGDVFATNNPFNGGTHLPDITVITPVFNESKNKIIFILASRGHHADIGGVTPGSCPPYSTIIDEEGIVIDNFLLIERGNFREQELHKLLSSGHYPCRNISQNITDLLAQVAANETGIRELKKAITKYTYPVVDAYMSHIQNNAEKSIRKTIANLQDCSFKYNLDSGAKILVKIKINKATNNIIFDFTGTSKQDKFNYNAPLSICKAVILYVLRTLIKSDIPLNDGFLRPIEIIAPKGTMINPHYPAAVISGNTEVSQAIADTLFGALGILSCSQGTMNNFAYGNDKYQNYETFCGGTGAGYGFNGTTVHSHMTNTKMLDPELLELRYPVRLDKLSIRHGSGGAGRWEGGDGIMRKLHFIEEMNVTILSSHRKIQPYGIAGGQPGSLGKNFILRKDGSKVQLQGNDQEILKPGDKFIMYTPGGGGYGTKNSNH